MKDVRPPRSIEGQVVNFYGLPPTEPVRPARSIEGQVIYFEEPSRMEVEKPSREDFLSSVEQAKAILKRRQEAKINKRKKLLIELKNFKKA